MNGVPSPEPEAGRSPGVIPWRMRPDLVVRRQDCGTWVIKDPISLSYVQLSDQEMGVLRLLDGRNTAGKVLQLLTRGWPEIGFTPDDLADFIGQLVRHQLVVPLQPLGGYRLHSRRGDQRLWKWLEAISAILRFRIRLLNPQPVLDACRPFLKSVFSRPAAIIAAAVVVGAICLVTLRFQQFMSALPGPVDFFGPENLLLVMVVFVCVKMLHEAGHALTARHFGADCTEAGVMLLVLTPVLYTNVTDAWMLDRRSRLMITAAGIATEVLLASSAAIVWFFAAPGLLKSVLANVMVICTVGTILFNGNPLLRYDGYFLLTDALGQPNLSQRSGQRIRQWLEDLLLGSRMLGSRSNSEQGEHRLLLIYGLCSGVYRTVLVVVILAFLTRCFDVWKLRILGATITLLVALPMIVVPITVFFSGLLAEWAFRDRRRLRFLRACVILGLLLIGFVVPLPRSVVAPAVVEPAGIPVFASIPGQLRSVVRYGSLLKAGDSVADLYDPQQELRRTKLSGLVSAHEARVRAMELRRDPAAVSSLPEARALLESAKQQLQEFNQELSRLNISAPVAGRLLPPRGRLDEQLEDALPEWTGYPLEPLNRGALITNGTVLGVICDPAQMELLVQLHADDAALLQRSQIAEFLSSHGPGLRWRGVVRRYALLRDEDAPSELMIAGLTLPPTVTRPGSNAAEWQAIVQIFVPEDASPPLLYSTGFVRIQVASASVATRLWQYLGKTFGQKSS